MGSWKGQGHKLAWLGIRWLGRPKSRSCIKVTKESSIYTANAVVVGNNFNTNASLDRKKVIKFAELINPLARRYFTGIALRYSNIK